MKTAKKRCNCCRRSKLPTEFHKNKRNRDGLQNSCKVCQRQYVRTTWAKRSASQRTEWADYYRQYRRQNPKKAALATKRYRVKRKYTITLDEYEQLVKNPCEICGKKSKKPHLDHCHQSGQLRGVLCSNCNVGLGFFLDDPQLLQQAAQYLKTHSLAAAS